MIGDVDLGALDAGARERLTAFARAFERLSAGTYAQFAPADTDEDELNAARDAAIAVLSAAELDAARDAARAMVDWAAARYSDRLALPDTLLLFQSLPDRAEDRVRVARSIGAAVLGVIAWDRLDEERRWLLIGPFEALIAEEGA